MTVRGLRTATKLNVREAQFERFWLAFPNKVGKPRGVHRVQGGYQALIQNSDFRRTSLSTAPWSSVISTA